MKVTQSLLSIWNELNSKFKTWIDFDRRGSDISTRATIHKTVKFHHKKMGVVIGSGVVIGKNCRIYQNVTLGERGNGFPSIGENVVIFPYSCIIGKVYVGENAVIGAGSIVLKDVPAGEVIKGVWK